MSRSTMSLLPLLGMWRKLEVLEFDFNNLDKLMICPGTCNEIFIKICKVEVSEGISHGKVLVLDFVLSLVAMLAGLGLGLFVNLIFCFTFVKLGP